MADAVASKAIEGDLMGVQVPSPAPETKKADYIHYSLPFIFSLFIYLKNPLEKVL